MRNNFAISDTHLYHANMLKFVDDNGRPVRAFSCVDEMNERIVDGWNSVVRDGDLIWHLGDVSFKYGSDLSRIMTRLRGKKRLTWGNHDRVKGTNLVDFFEKAEFWKPWKEHGFVYSHMPLRKDQMRGGAFNVHGHTHVRMVLDENGKVDPAYINVCVEPRNFIPMHLDEIIAEIKRRGG